MVEVGPRDGLQNEPDVLPLEVKARFVNQLARAGCPEIEFGSFVSAKWVPQLADSDALAARLPAGLPTVFTALVPNLKGLERARAAGVKSIAVFTAASESFSRRNVNATIDQTFERFRPVVDGARQAGLRVRGYVSTAFACPYEGWIDPRQAVRVAARLFEMGVAEVSIGDTIGVATPRHVRAFLDAALGTLDPAATAFHFHDTRGTALANIVTAWEGGASIFDSSAGGLGGCPYAPGAGGNVATEDAVYLLHGMGARTGIDIDRVVEASRGIEEALGRPLPSKVYRAQRASRPTPLDRGGNTALP
jgi:isopropylmalate/homocitrate/citramalate synthase